MKIAPIKTNEEHKPLSRWILVTLIVLPLVTVWNGWSARRYGCGTRAGQGSRSGFDLFSFQFQISRSLGEYQGGKGFRGGPDSHRHA